MVITNQRFHTTTGSMDGSEVLSTLFGQQSKDPISLIIIVYGFVFGYRLCHYILFAAEIQPYIMKRDLTVVAKEKMSNSISLRNHLSRRIATGN